MRAAEREALKAAVDARKREVASVTVRCGRDATQSRYRHGCHCQDCRAAEARYRRELRARRKATA